MNSETFLNGRVTLYLGDCIPILQGMEADSIGLFCADPPYEAHMHDAKRGVKIYGSEKRIRNDGHANPPPVDFDCITSEVRFETARQMVRISSGWSLVFCTPEGIAPWRDAFEAAGGKYKRACFWHKPDSAPQFNGQGPAMAVEAFVAVWCGKGHARWNGGGRRNLWTYQTNSRFRDGRHSTEKPVDLICELVSLFSDDDALVCDPFMGSGTTAVACSLTHRRFIGMEAKPEYFEIARQRIEGKRIDHSVPDGPLFAGVAAQ